jgi:hypothetical protein
MTSIQETPVSYGLVGQIIEAKGEVLLKRKHWSEYRLTRVGAELYPGDLLQPASGARVLVQCANGKTIWSVPEGVISGATNGCPPQAVPISRRPGDIIPPRSSTNPLIPYIISPRRTLLLNPLPTLRWNAVPGALSYSVSLIGDEDVIWEEQVSETEVVYPGEPPLEPGVDYLLIVDADTGASSQEEEFPSLGFSLLDETEATVVRDSLKQLASLELADEALALATVNLYIGYDLKAEAIETLEALVKQGSQTATVHRTLGKLYQEVGLTRLALTRYLRAAELAAEVEDVEGQAAVAVGLGQVYQAVADSEAARRWLTQAGDGYAALGDRQRVSELEEQLAKLTTGSAE